MTTIRARLALSRIPAEVEKARGLFTLTGPDEWGMWWVMNPAIRSGIGHYSEAEQLAEREKKAAIHVLEHVARIEDWHDYDWHLWFHDAELMVREVIRRGLECRRAAAELAPLPGDLRRRAGRCQAEDEAMTTALPPILAAIRARLDATDLAEQVFVLREALRDLVRLDQMERDGQAHADQPERWRKAWAAAVDVLDEEGRS